MLTSDKLLPGLRPALDVGTVGPLLAAAVIPRHMELRSLKVERFRYDPGDRATVPTIVYDAEFSAGRSGRRQRTWLTATLHAEGKGEALAQELSRSANPTRGIEGLPVAAYVSSLGALIQTFPHDWRLPALKEYQDGSSPALRAFLRGHADNAGGCAPRVEIFPVRYRPGKQAVLRVSLPEEPATGDRGRKLFYIKLRAAAARLETYDPLRSLSGSGRQRRFCIVSPVANLEADHAAVYEAAPGTSFAELVRSKRLIASSARQIGRGLAAFHSSDASALPRGNGQRLSAKATGAVRSIEWACPAIAPAAKRILSRLEDLPSPSELWPTHYNMKPEHIFLGSDGVIHLIDTESARADDPAIDVGCLLAWLDALEHLAGVPQDDIATARYSLEAGYFEEVCAARQDRIEAARAYGGLLVARHSIHHLLPGWEAHMAVALERAWNYLERADRRRVA